MEIKDFDKILKANNFLFLNDTYIIFNDYELYNEKTFKSIENKSLEDLLKNKIKGKTIEQLIKEKDAFYLRVNGGRGAISNLLKGEMGFSSAPGRMAKSEKLLNAELNIKQASGNSVDSVLKRFQSKYGDANREYAIVVDENGYVHQHLKGGKHSVGVQGDKGEVIIHNHPSGSNFSKADLENVSSTKARGVIATSSNAKVKGTYTFTKNENFKAKEFLKALNKASWDKKLGYNKGASQWLKKNQRKYGYKYTYKGVK